MPEKSARKGYLDSLTAPRARCAGLLAVLVLLSSCGLFITPQHRIAAAKRDIKAGNWQEAAIELRAVIQRDRANAEAWQLLADISLDSGDLKGAQSALSQALAAGARGAAVDALRLRLWLAAGQPTEVLDALAHHAVDPGEPTKSLLQAKAYIALARPDEAIRTLQPIVAGQPDLTEARVEIAEALARQNKLDEALEQVDAAMQADKRDPLPPLLQARILASRGQYVGAENALTLAVQHMSPAQPLQDRVRALVLLTEVRLAEDKIDAAAQSQVALANLIPIAPVSELLSARIQLARGNLTAAIDQLEGVVAKAPDYAKARLYLGAAELARGELQLAEQQLEQVVGRAPDDGQARKLLATVHLRMGQPAAAMAVLTPVLESHVLDPQLLSLVRAAGADASSRQALMKTLERRLRVDPENQTIALNLAHLQGASGDLQSARKTLADALATNPGSAPIRIALAAVLASSKDFVQARELLQPVDGPGAAPQVNFAIARIYLAEGDVKSAQFALDQAVASQPGQAPLMEEAGVLLLQDAQYRPAAREFEAALQEQPDDVVALNNLAWIYGKVDDARAEAIAERAYRIAPESAEVEDTLGWILARRHEATVAVPLLAHAADLAPKDPDIEYHYAYALAANGKRDQARGILTQILLNSRPFDSRADAERLLASVKAN